MLMDCTIVNIFWEQTKELTEVKLPTLHPESWARDLLVAWDSETESYYHLWHVVPLDAAK
jgi:hypothetical protein